MMSPTSGNGMSSLHQSGHNYSGVNPHSSSSSNNNNSNSINNGSAVPSSQSVQQLVMGNGAGASGSAPMSTNAMMCVAHSQSAHQLGLHQQLQQRFAAAAASAASASNNYGELRILLIAVKSKVKPFIAHLPVRMPQEGI